MNNYKAAYEKIQVPPDLIQRTAAKMNDELAGRTVVNTDDGSAGRTAVNTDDGLAGYTAVNMDNESVGRTAVNADDGLARRTVIKSNRRRYFALGTACAVILILIPLVINMLNPKIILTELNDAQFVEQVQLTNGFLVFHESGSFTVPPRLGSVGSPEQKPENKASIAITTAYNSLPDLCDDSLEMDSVMNGLPLCVGKNDANRYFAQFMLEDIGYYVVGENISQSQFIMQIYKIVSGKIR